MKLPDPPLDLPEGTLSVVKVQRPPNGRDEHASWLLFARGLKHFRRVTIADLPASVVEPLLLEGAHKAYFRAQVRAGTWHFIQQVLDEDW